MNLGSIDIKEFKNLNYNGERIEGKWSFDSTYKNMIINTNLMTFL